MKEDQRKILRRIAAEQGISVTQAEEVWSLFCKKLEYEISSNKKVDGILDIDKFSVIHIDNFGKFIPNKKNIRFANEHLKKEKDKLKIFINGSNTSE